MNYDRDEFFRLMEAIEEQGGEYVDEVHDHSVYAEYAGGPVEDVQFGYVKNCGESALFEIPYGSTFALARGSNGTLKVCIKDDMVGRWPRFADASAQGTV